MKRFELTYYATGMTPRVHVLPEGTSEELAIEIARNMRDDPYAGFLHLREVRDIELGQEGGTKEA